MNKLLLLLCIPLFCLSCADSDAVPPIIEITGIFLCNDDKDTNYVDRLAEMPDLAAGDELDVLFVLEGNGNDLRSFIVVNENSAIETVLPFEGDEISQDFSELKEGKAVFVDGIDATGVTVKVKIKAPLTQDQPLSFLLNSKSTDSKSAKVSVDFKSKRISYR